MPIYEFRCEKCGRDFEELVRGANPKVVCPGCGGRKCRKLMSASRFVSKGANGGTTASSAGGGGCSGCAGGSACATCGH
ncbi:MAG: zinc ribbon domain-containing protein [Candidatus Adiutrix sp.]|jgi:putative FmdB family regulatory protein|nr:zinc ribbon domain-containing protein [Candidatus Adiutrix sp.]